MRHIFSNLMGILAKQSLAQPKNSNPLKMYGRKPGPSHICEKFTREIRTCITQSYLPINLVALPPFNLRKICHTQGPRSTTCHFKNSEYIICKHNKSGSCILQEVVNKIICQCEQFYIGETGCPLHEWITEHVRGIQKSRSYILRKSSSS